MKHISDITTLQPYERQALADFKARVDRLLPGTEVILYGSKARGDAGPESDIDVLAIVPCPATSALWNAFEDAKFEVELEFDVIVGLMLRTRTEWESSLLRATPFHQNVDSDGVLV